MRPGRNAVSQFEFHEIVTGKAALLQAELKSHLCMYLVQCVCCSVVTSRLQDVQVTADCCVARALTDDALA